MNSFTQWFNKMAYPEWSALAHVLTVLLAFLGIYLWYYNNPNYMFVLVVAIITGIHGLQHQFLEFELRYFEKNGIQY